MSYEQDIKKANDENKLEQAAFNNLRDNRKTAHGFTVGDIVSSDFWYGEKLTWEVKGFDGDDVKLSCVEYGMPIQIAHNSKLIVT